MRRFRVTHKSSPWINEEICNIMSKRDKIKAKYNVTKDNLTFDSYKSHKNKVNHMTRKAKINYFDEVINSKINNTKDFWAALKKLLVVSETTNSPLICSAAVLNKTFLENNNAPIDSNLIDAEINKIRQNIIPSQFQFICATEVDVIKCIRSVSTKSCGIDGISIEFLKLCIPYCIPALTHIINFSLEQCKFPSKWKKAIIKPLNKCPNPAYPTDYRPVSILSVLSKMLEKVVYSQVSEYLVNNNLLDLYQSGFRKYHSTTTALLKITDDMFNAIDQSEVSFLVLLDYSKAFDTVNHRLLLAKMEKLGLSEFVLSWFSSYLTDRSQKVVTKWDESGWDGMNNGVPQGSVLGPLLFSIMVCDLKESVNNGKYHMYADDTQLYCHSHIENLNDTVKQINEDLNNIAGYSSRNLLHLNASKSAYIVIGSHRNVLSVNNKSYPPILLNDAPLERHTFVKNLGVTFDEVLSWRKHISISIGKAYSKLKYLYRFKKCFIF